LGGYVLSRRAVSQVIGTLILFSIVISGILFVYGVFDGNFFATTLQKSFILAEVKGERATPGILLIFTVENTGDVRITRLEVFVDGEDVTGCFQWAGAPIDPGASIKHSGLLTGFEEKKHVLTVKAFFEDGSSRAEISEFYA